MLNTCQFIIYIGMWQINYSDGLSIFFSTLRKIAFGEFLDDLKISQSLSNAFGFDVEMKDPTENKVGKERLGEKDIASNLGATLICASILSAIVIAILLILVLIRRKVILSEKNEKRYKAVRNFFLYNPIIRYLMLCALKFYMTAFVMLQAYDNESSVITQSLLILLLMIALPIFLSVVLYRKQYQLEDTDLRS